MDNKKYDWLAVLAKNPEATVQDLSDNGINPDTANLLDYDAYKDIPEVREMFQTDGKFDEKKLKVYYDNAKSLYNDMANEELVSKVINTYGADEWYVSKDDELRDDNPKFVVTKPDINAHGISYITQSTESNLSLREIAQREKVVDSETGETLDYSPNDKAGLFTQLSMPTMVLATYDEDEFDQNTGELLHKAGDIKYNDRGRPYYETLGNREIYNKDTLNYTDIITVDGSKWNKLDFLDSDDTKKSAGKVIAKTLFSAIPMFIPVVGEIYGYAAASAVLAKTMPTFLKAINNTFGGGETQLGEGLNKLEGYMSRFNETSSDYSKEHVVSLENLGNLISSISGQLFQQRAISSIPALIKKGKNLDSSSKLGQRLALGYMAATSAEQVYGDFKRAGANDTVAGLGLLASTAVLYKLMDIDYFRDLFFRNTFMDESPIRYATRKASKEVAQQLSKDITAATPKEAAGLFKKLSNLYHNKLVPGLIGNEFIDRSLSEGVEEVMEEGVTDAIKGVTSALNALGLTVTEPNKELDFGFSLKDIATRYGMSFVGGTIGGALFNAQNRYEKLLWRVQNNIAKQDISGIKQLTYYLAEGKRNEIQAVLDKYRKKGLLGNENLGLDGEIKQKSDGTYEVVSSTTGMNQNEAVYNVLNNTLDVMEQIIKNELVSPEGLVSEEGIKGLIAAGYKDEDVRKNQKLLTAASLVGLGECSNFSNDLYDVLAKITQKQLLLQQKIKELSTVQTTEPERQQQSSNIESNAEIKALKKEIEDLRKVKDEFLTGKKNRYYIGQAAFSLNTPLQQNFINLSKENYTQVVKGVDYDSLSNEAKRNIDEEYTNYMNTEGRKQVYRAYDLYLQLSNRYSGVLKAEQDKLEKAYKKRSEDKKLILFSDFAKINDDLIKIGTRLKELEAKPDRTEEEDVEYAMSLQKFAELKNESDLWLQNPALLLTDSSILMNAIKTASNSETQLFTPYTDPEAIQKNDKVLEQLRKAVLTQYRADSTSDEYRLDDLEMNTFLNLVKADYNKRADIQKRLENFQWKAADRISDQSKDVNWEDLISNDSADLVKLINNIQKNLGEDNKKTLEAYAELKSYIGEHSYLLDSGFEADWALFVKEVLPNIDGISLEDTIKELEQYRSTINYSAFTKLLSIVAEDFQGTPTKNIVQVVNSEISKLAAAPSLDQYLIQNKDILAQLSPENSSPILKAVIGVIQGASDGTNHLINSYKPEKNDAQVLELSEEASHILKGQASEFSEKIQGLYKFATRGANLAINKQQRIQTNMRPKFIKALTSSNSLIAFSQVFGEQKKVALQQLIETLPEEINTENYPDIEKQIIAIEDFIYDCFKEANLSTNDLRNKILAISQIDKSTFYKQASTKLSDKDNIKISPIDLVWYLTSLGTIKSSTFYSAYKDLINSKDFSTLSGDEKKMLSPIYGQAYSIRVAASYILKAGIFNKILSNLQSSINITEPLTDKQKTYIKNKPVLYNFLEILGGAGTGKTAGIIKSLVNLIGKENLDIVCVAPSEKLVNALKSNLESEKGYTTTDFFDKYLGGNFIDYETINCHPTSKKQAKVNSNIQSEETPFNNTGTLKLLVIDEIETFTEPELKRLTTEATAKGFVILGLGDTKQPPKKLSNNLVSGLEDCVAVKTPILTATLRGLNSAKVRNTESLHDLLEPFETRLSKNPAIEAAELSTNIQQEMRENLKLIYYEDASDFQGTKLVQTREEFEKYAQKLIGDVALISSKDLGNLTKISPYKVAGNEWDYILVDIDFNDIVGQVKLGELNWYQFTKWLYTLTQRSRKGTIILDNNDIISRIKGNVLDPNANFQVEIDNNSRIRFTEWVNKGLDTIIGDRTTLQELFKNRIPPINPVPPIAPVPPINPVPPIAPVPPINPTPPSSTLPPTPPGTPIPSTPSVSTPPSEPIPPAPPSSSVPSTSSSNSTLSSTTSSGNEKKKYLTLGQFVKDFIYTDNFIKWSNTRGDKSFINVLNDVEAARKLTSIISSAIFRNRCTSSDELPISWDKVISSIETFINSNSDIFENSHDIAIDFINSIKEDDIELYIEEFDQSHGILVAKVGNVDLPMCIISNPPKYGKYTGNFEKIENLTIDPITESSDDVEIYTLEEFKEKFPELYIDDQPVVIKGVLDDYSDYTKRTRKWLFDNNGKTFIGVTDKGIMALNDLNGRGMWVDTIDSGDGLYTIVNGLHTWCRLGIQCRCSIEQLHALLSVYYSECGNKSNLVKSNFENDEDLKHQASATSSILNDVRSLQRDFQGNILPFFPYNRAGMILKTFSDLYPTLVKSRMQDFLSGTSIDNERTTYKAIELYLGYTIDSLGNKQDVYKTVVFTQDGCYKLENSRDGYTLSERLLDSTAIDSLNIDAIISKLVESDPSLESVIKTIKCPGIQFITYKKKDNKWTWDRYTTNSQLMYFLQGVMADSDALSWFKDNGNNSYLKYSMYLNDTIDPHMAEQSLSTMAVPLKENNRTYTIAVHKRNPIRKYTQYALSVNDIEEIPTENNKPLNNWRDVLREIDPTIVANSIEEANTKLIRKANSPFMFKQIRYTNNQYTILEDFDETWAVQSWFSIKFNRTLEDPKSYIFEGIGYTTNGEIVFYDKENDNYYFIPISKDLYDLASTIYWSTIYSDYVFNQLTKGTYNYNRNELLDLLNSNSGLQIAEKISIFAEKCNEEFGCY